MLSSVTNFSSALHRREGACLRFSRLSLTLALMALAPVALAADNPSRDRASTTGIVDEIVVAAPRSIISRAGGMGSVDALDEEQIRAGGATHANEALVAIPGVWVSRGSGQEQLTAIRSAILTGPGACGAFLFAENGIPIRPSGFCNLNNLFEVNTEQAAAIEVWRGPGSAALGGNALRGAINVITAVPDANRLSIEAGPYDYYRAGLQWQGTTAGHDLGISVHSTHSGGYRDATGYGQQKLTLHHATEVAGWQVRNTLSASLLNQETGGFVRGFAAFEDADLRKTNPNPEAYRDAWALRVMSQWQRDAWTLTPYLRRSQMAFLQHFLPGQPLETNDQSSGGLVAKYAIEGDRVSWSVGAQAEYMQSSLREFQAGPTLGSNFLVQTRPSGLHYDYEVDSTMVALFADAQWQLSENWRLMESVRIERLAYDYDNLHINGNTRDDGSVCGFGGCRYTRPADRDDTFTDWAARLGVARDIGAAEIYATLGTGFRAPQATELYRLQDGQNVADIDSERLTSLEVGTRWAQGSFAVYRQKTRHFIFRDADGFNVDNGRTESLGAELAWQPVWRENEFSLVAGYARHRYDFSSSVGGGEVITDGNMLDTAPRWLGSARWARAWGEQTRSELEVVHVGDHYLNASNTARYEGHWVANLRLTHALPSTGGEVFVRVMNLTDADYADRADFAFGSYRYFPGMPRQVYLGYRHQFN